MWKVSWLAVFIGLSSAAIWLIPPCSWGEERKRRWKSAKFEAKNMVFEK